MSRFNAANIALLNAAAAQAPSPVNYNPKFANDADLTAIFAALVGDPAIGAGTPAQVGAMHLDLALALADVGTSDAADYSQVMLQNTVRGAAVPMSTYVNHIKATTRIRRFARAFADVVYDAAKSRGLAFAVGTAHGIPPAYGHCGFDFADGITPSKLSNDEAIAIESAKRVGLFKAAAAAVTNTSALFHHGGPAPTSAPRGLLM